MRRQPVVVALVAGVLALVGLPAAPAAPAPSTPGVPRSASAASTPFTASPAVTPFTAVQPGEADDGLRAEASTRFVVDPGARAIHATTTVTLTNNVPDQTRDGIIEQYYFFQYAIPVLSEATGARAETDDGTPLTVNVVASDDAAQQWVDLAEIQLSPQLHYNQTQTIELSYDVPYQPARSPGLSRANDALVMFPAFSPGDPGITSIEVQLPPSFSVEVVGDALERQERDGQTVLTASAIENPDLFTAIVVATDDAELLTEHIEVAGRDVQVRAWPGDEQWADFVGEQLGDIMPTLDALVGQPWPTERGLEVIETASPYAHGYAGWYDQVDHSISLGDELDALVIAHELTHVWFNADLFDARWINEAFAEEYAQTTMQQLGRDAPTHTAPDRNGAGAVALNDWHPPSLLEPQDDAVESYGYAASAYVMDQIATEIGVAELRDVIGAVADDRIPYVGDPEAEEVPGVAGWQRLLDQLENVGGSLRASELFGQYVVADAGQRDALAARAEARLLYAGLDERGGGWTPPLEVRLAMTDWEFGAAAEAVIEANGVLDVRDDIDEVLDGLDVGDLALEDAYESARDLGEVNAAAAGTLEAAEAYKATDARMEAGPGLVGTIGLIGAGTDDRLDDAADELAGGDPEASLDASAAVDADLDDATRNGLIRLAGFFVLLALVGVVLERRLGRQRRRRTAEAEIAQLEALYSRRPAETPAGPDGLRRQTDPHHPQPHHPDHPDWPN
jgi:hypothetical protein